MNDELVTTEEPVHVPQIAVDLQNEQRAASPAAPLAPARLWTQPPRATLWHFFITVQRGSPEHPQFVVQSLCGHHQNPSKDSHQTTTPHPRCICTACQRGLGKLIASGALS